MIFTADKLKEARDAGYSDDEIFGFASQADPKFNDAKSEGYSLDEIASHFSTQQPRSTTDKVGDFLQSTAMDLEDAIGVIGRIPEALATGIPAQYQKLVSGTAMPKKSEAIEADLAFQAQTQKELEDRKASGELGVMGGALREALPSLSASAVPLAAAIPAGIAGTAVAGPAGGAVGAGLASGAVSYRMQGADYLYRAFKQLEENKGSPLTDEEKAKAYKVLLPLAQESALWEAGPEAVGNAVSLGVGKFVFGFGKEAATQLAKESTKAVEKTLARKVAEKSAAIVGGAATEVGTETITALGQYAPEMAAKQYAETGTIKGAPTEYPGGIMQAAKDVAPATLATQALFMGAGGAVKLAGLPFEAKPKTPVQIATDNIDIQANKEATNLSIDPADEVGKGLSETINSIQSNLVNKKEVYSVLEATDPAARTLKLEIQDDENRLTLMQAELNKRAGVEVTQEEKAKVEEAKKAATPEVALPVTEVAAPVTPTPTEVTPTEVAVAEAATPVVNQEFKDELEMSGVAYDGDTRYSVQQSSNGTFRAERIVNGKKEDIQIGLPDIETAQNVILNSVGKEVPAIVAETPTPAAQEAPQQKPSGMSVEESKAYLEERNKSTIFGYPTEDIMAKQQGKQVGRTISAPVAETPAVTEAPAAEVAPASWIAPEQKLTPQESRALQVANLRGTEKRTGNITFVPEKLMTPQRLQSLRTEKESSSPLKDFPRGGKFIEIKMMADVTGDPYAKGWAIIDRRKEIASQPQLKEVKQITESERRVNASNWQKTIVDPKDWIVGYDIVRSDTDNLIQAINDGKVSLERTIEIIDDALNNNAITQGYANTAKDRIQKAFPTPAVSETITKPKLGEKGGILIPTKEDFIQAGQNIYEKGMEFGAWAKQMIQQFGDVVREFLGDVWQAVSGAPAKLNELMGYLPGRGEAGSLTVGDDGKLERYTDKGTIVGLAIRQEKDTPKGILSETIKIIKQRVFDGDSTPSESVTKKAWGLIERLQVTNENSAENAEAINQLTRETMQEVSAPEGSTDAEEKAFESIKQTVGAAKLRNELFQYAIKLAGQGDNSMLNYLLNNDLNLVGTSVKTASDLGRFLGSLQGLKSWIVQANEAEQSGFIELAAQRFFDTKTPTQDQIDKVKSILTAVTETKVNEEEAILDELTTKGNKVGVDLVDKLNEQIEKSTKPEIKDPFVAAITAMLRMGGTFVYTKTKNKIKAAVEKTIKSGITNYRSKLIEGAADGLETGFWKTLSNQENKPGPLGELDNAQNRELGSIVKNALISLGLKGTPPNTKMSIYEQVASILGEKPLSQDKTKSADERIRQEIESKRQSELESTEDEDAQNAIDLKYDKIELAWDQAMSRQLDMPISDTLLRRLIFNELKEGKTNLAGLAELMNNDPTVGTSRQNMIVSAIINKIAGVTFEGQNPANYSLFREYLSNNLESMVQEKQMEKKVVKVKEKVEANQAEREIDKLARIQSDTPNFPTSEKIANPVRDAVRNALKLVLNPMFDPKAAAEIMNNWKKSFAAELQTLGVDEATALTLTDIVGRQIELDSISKNLQTITNAVEKGALNNVIDAIKNTPLAEQQKPNWRHDVMFDYLRNAGLTKEQAGRIAKLMDDALQKRFSQAQEQAATSIAEKLLKGIKPESNRGFVALIQAIRSQALNPGSNVAKEFGNIMGWKGFTSEQIKTLNELDSKINDETITEAERAVALEGIKKIIDKIALPTRVRDSLSAFYIGNALGRFTVATVQVIDPIIFSMWDAAVASARNVTSPSQVMQIWGNFGSSLINAAKEFAFSFKNDVTRSGRLVDYLETQDRKLKRLRDDADNLWRNGQYKQAIKKYLFSYPEITSRVLKALDDASFSLLQQNALNQYMISAMNMAKIPKKDQLGALRMIAQARQMDIANMMSDGISKNDATIYANERMKAEISRIMSGLNLNSSEIIDSAINDSLARIGKTRFKEQFSGEAEFKDEGTLSFPFLKIYEKISQAISTEKGTQGEVMRIFQRILVGFPLIVARVANVAYGYTPITLYRHIFKGRYPLTYGTAIQRRKRLVEQLTGFAVLAPLFFLRSMSFDDDEEKPVRIVFTGFGPVRSKDPEAYNQWNKKHNPGSLEIFIGGKRYGLDSKSAGPLKPMIEILGAIDDWQIRKHQDNVKIKKSDLTNAQENAGLLSTLSQIAGSFALTAARRGPATGLMQGLIDFRRYPDDPIAAIAQEASFSLMPFVPVVGYGATKNFSDFLSDPIDTRTKEGAILNNIPIVGPMFGKPAINSFGQPLGDVQISEKIKKSIGIPVTVVSVGTEDEQKLTKITLKNGDGPQPLNRGEFDKKLGSPLTDEEWRTATETYARENRKAVLSDYKFLNDLDPEDYRKAISTISSSSKNEALFKIDDQRKK